MNGSCFFLFVVARIFLSQVVTHQHLLYRHVYGSIMKIEDRFTDFGTRRTFWKGDSHSLQTVSSVANVSRLCAIGEIAFAFP
jgi:hypothetical protein